MIKVHPIANKSFKLQLSISAGIKTKKNEKETQNIQKKLKYHFKKNQYYKKNKKKPNNESYLKTSLTTSPQ